MSDPRPWMQHDDDRKRDARTDGPRATTRWVGVTQPRDVARGRRP